MIPTYAVTVVITSLPFIRIIIVISIIIPSVYILTDSQTVTIFVACKWADRDMYCSWCTKLRDIVKCRQRVWQLKTNNLSIHHTIHMLGCYAPFAQVCTNPTFIIQLYYDPSDEYNFYGYLFISLLWYAWEKKKKCTKCWERNRVNSS